MTPAALTESYVVCAEGQKPLVLVRGRVHVCGRAGVRACVRLAQFELLSEHRTKPTIVFASSVEAAHRLCALMPITYTLIPIMSTLIPMT